MTQSIAGIASLRAFRFRSWCFVLAIVGAVASLVGAAPISAADTPHAHGNAKPNSGGAVAWVRTQASGPWSAAATWVGGKPPAAGDRVHVHSGHSVVYDVNSDQALRAVYVSGRLSFAPDRDTRLDVGVLKVEAGDRPSEDGFDCDAHPVAAHGDGPRATVEVGTPERPIAAAHTAKIRLVAFAGQDPGSCPAIVCCGGRLDFHGAPLSRTWLKLGATAAQGAAGLTLSEPVSGWRAGDRVIVTATKLGRDNGGSLDKLQTEQRVLKAVSGAELTFDAPLEFAHRGEGEFRGEAANLSRNVIVESADPNGVRGHTMYHHGSAGSISYAEFRHLGKKNVLGRYSLHFHLVGDSMRGSYVHGASIWDSHNRWLTVHGTNYLVVRDNVGYQSVGHGFFLEDGTEVQNVFDRNLAVQAMHGRKLPKQVLAFDGNEGAGFWWANSFNTFTRNVTCENDRYGYRFEATETSGGKLSLPVRQADGSTERVDIRTLPFVRFEDNEAHCDGLYGINLGEGVRRVGPDARHPFVMRNTKIWEVHYAFRPMSPSLLVEKLQIHEPIYGVYHPNFDRHVYRDVAITREGLSGDAEPFNRGHDDDSVQYGSLTVDGLTFANHRASGMPLIQISDHNPTGKAESHFRNVRVIEGRDKRRRSLVNLGGGPRPQPSSPTSVPVYLHDHFGPGQHAKVVSAKSGELQGADAASYRMEPPLTGDESRVTTVTKLDFPRLLDPVDDQPPATVVTRVVRTAEGWTVEGSTSDNGEVRQVTVNGVIAEATRGNFAEWKAKLPPGDQELVALGVDAAGNVEKTPHRRAVR